MTITQKTLIPISFFISLAPAIYWLASSANATAQNTKDIARVVDYIDEHGKMLSHINSDVSSLNAKMDIVLSRQKGVK